MNLEKGNYKIENLIKEGYISSFQAVSDELYYLILICTKVLQCSKGSRNISIDTDRLYDEFVYFKYYTSMSDDYLLNFFMPLMIANRSFESYEQELIELIDKLCKFYGSEGEKYDYTIDVFCYDIIIRKLLLSKTDMLEILYEIKDKLIEFNPYSFDKKKNVHFQIKKIKYIEKIHKCIDNYEIEKKETFFESEIKLIDILQCVYNVKDVDIILSRMDYGSKSVYNFIKRLLKTDSEEETIKNKKFIEAMGDYLIKLRNAEINSKKYKFNSSPKAFLNKNIGDEFIDPILNQAQIVSKKIEKEKGEDIYIIDVSTKTGDYRFRYQRNKK